MPRACSGPKASPATMTPNAVPTTGLTSPIRDTAPAGITRSPVNQHQYASPVPATISQRYPATAGPPRWGGGPSTTSATGSSARPPTTSCHETRVSMSTGGTQRLTSTKPSAETITEPKAPTRPSASSRPGERRTSSATPTSPTPAATRRVDPARSPMTAAARAITASGEVACRVEARPPGSR